MNRGGHKSRQLSTSCGNLTMTRSHPVSSRSTISENVIRFQEGIRQRLSTSNQDLVTDILSLYHRNRNVPHLVASLTKVLKTRETQSIFFLLREVLPHCDRPEYDHYVSMHFYKLQRDPSVNSRGHTIDSGFGSNSAATHSTAPRQPKYRSSGRKVNGFENSASSSGHSSTFGSAVRRKVIAALQRTGSRNKKAPTDRTRRHSFAGHAETNAEVHTKKRYADRSASQKLVIPADAQEVVIDRLKSRSGDMGFSIRGGTDHNMGIFVSQVDPNSIAEKAGLMLGDRLLLLNGCEMHNLSHEDTVKMLTSHSRLYLTVQPNAELASVDANPSFAWADAHGRPSSPPYPHQIRKKQSELGLVSCNQRKVNISVRPGQSLGLMIRGGIEYNLGIFITGVDQNSAADNAGLKPGDEILEVNGMDFREITHTEAVNVIRTSSMLMMTVAHVGKIPQCDVSQAPFDDVTINQQSMTLPRRPGGSIGAFDRAVTGSDQVTLRHAQSTTSLSLSTLDRAMNNLLLEHNDQRLLTDEEQKSVRYYVNEYTRGNVTIDELVLSLSQLLSTHEKFAVMSAVRRCVLSRDLDRFDVLVLRRELESLKKAHLMNVKQQQRQSIRATDVPRSSPEHIYAVVDKTKKIDHTIGTCNDSPQKSNLTVNSTGTNTGPPVNSSHLSASEISTSTPNNSAELPPPPPIIVTPPNQNVNHAKLKKTISPILRNAGVLPLRCDPPTKPKRNKSVNGGSRESFHSHNSYAPAQKLHVKRASSPFSQALEKQCNQKATTSHNHSSSDDSFVCHGELNTTNVYTNGLDSRGHSSGNPPYLNVNESRNGCIEEYTNYNFPPVPKIQVAEPPRSHPIQQANFDDEDSEGSESDPMEFYRNVETQKIIVFKTTGALGLSIEGGANTRQPLPRVSKIQPGGCAHLCGRLLPGHVIHRVNGFSLEEIEHTEVAKIIASAFKEKNRDSVELEISGPHQTTSL